MRKIGYLITLLRLKQWIKNLFIIFPLIFSGQLFVPELLQDCLLTLLGFCLISSGVYVFNDFFDRERDRVHPKKSKRVLAQEQFSTAFLLCLIGALLGLGMYISCLAIPHMVWAALFYIFLHLIYNFYAKKIVILDVIFIAAGFQIRIWAGSLAASAPPSVWLQLCVFLLALFLGFTKRRHEISTLRDHAPEHRSVLKHYTTYLLDQIIIICSTLAVVFYGLYTISSEIALREGNHNIVYSTGFVLYGMFRYLYLVHVKKLGGDPGEIVFSDKPLLLDILFWGVFIVMIVYY